jgi:hypothetical protein
MPKRENSDEPVVWAIINADARGVESILMIVDERDEANAIAAELRLLGRRIDVADMPRRIVDGELPDV